MSDDLVQLKLAPIFSDLRKDVERFQLDVLVRGASILRREYESSIRQRWYRTGATLQSLRQVFVDKGDSRSIWIYPTATNNGAPYPLFGEYGTGRQGAATGRPAPSGYTYGRRHGMEARRFSRIAVATARPLVDASASERVRQFARNMTQ